jgi:threonine synthase
VLPGGGKVVPSMPVERLTCFACGQTYPADRLAGLCACGKPLRVDYDLSDIGPPETVLKPRNDLWRYRVALPLPAEVEPKTLGEGGTPLLPAQRLSQSLGHEGEFWIKDESVNPTGSFKARGMALAVAMADRFGLRKLAVPSAGNAGGALAAYAALYGIEAHVFLPRDVPQANRLECELYGAKVTLVDGLIHDCAAKVREGQDREGWFDVSTLKEPYRIEGKKTMGYEIAEQLGWRYPDVILYPTGGGTGLIGVWKAFEEMERMGWIRGKRPRMVSVQAEGCAPIVRAWAQARGQAAPPSQDAPHTIAAGLRVPKALGDFVILEVLRQSGGTAVAVSDEELIRDGRELMRLTGAAACPESGACLAAYKKLRERQEVGAAESVVLFNTGTGLKYAEAWNAFPD